MAAEQAHPPQVVRDWIDLAVRHIEATQGIGCPECRGGLPSDAALRGHDHHPKDCKRSLVAVLAANDMACFLTQPAGCWYGLPSAPPDLSGLRREEPTDG